MSMFRVSLLTAALALAALASPARAELVVSVSSGSNTYYATDSSTPGTATYSGSVGNFNVTLNTGTGYPLIGSPTDPVIDLSSLDVATGATGGTLTVSLTETGFKSIAAVEEFLSSMTGNYKNSKAVLSTYVDSSNAKFGQGTLLSGGLLDNAQATALAALKGTFSITEVIVITAGGNSLTSLDASVTAVPEPFTLSLVGAGLLGLGLVRRRQRT